MLKSTGKTAVSTIITTKRDFCVCSYNVESTHHRMCIVCVLVLPTWRNKRWITKKLYWHARHKKRWSDKHPSQLLPFYRSNSAQRWRLATPVEPRLPLYSSRHCSNNTKNNHIVQPTILRKLLKLFLQLFPPCSCEWAYCFPLLSTNMALNAANATYSNN